MSNFSGDETAPFFGFLGEAWGSVQQGEERRRGGVHGCDAGEARDEVDSSCYHGRSSEDLRSQLICPYTLSASLSGQVTNHSIIIWQLFWKGNCLSLLFFTRMKIKLIVEFATLDIYP